jgi:hypothetical protein
VVAGALTPATTRARARFEGRTVAAQEIAVDLCGLRLVHVESALIRVGSIPIGPRSRRRRVLVLSVTLDGHERLQAADADALTVTTGRTGPARTLRYSRLRPALGGYCRAG